MDSALDRDTKHYDQTQVFTIDTLAVVYFAFSIFSVSFQFFIPFTTTVVVGIGLVIYMTSFALSKDSYSIPITEIGLILLFLFLLWINSFFTDAPKYGSLKFNLTAINICSYLLVSKALIRNLKAFLISNIVLGFILIVLLYIEFGDPLTYLANAKSNSDRLQSLNDDGTDLNPIFVSRYIGLSLISLMILHKLVKFNLFVKILLIAFLINGFLFMVTSGSRGPFIALFASILISSKQKLWMVIAFILAGLLVLQLIEVENKFILQRFSPNSADSGGIDRLELIEKVLYHLDLNRFYTGHGTGQCGYILTNVDEIYYPHNILVELFYENGIFSPVILLFLVIKAAWIRFKEKNKILEFIFFLILYTFINAQFSADLVGNNLMFLFIILFFAYHRNMNDLASPQNQTLD